MATCASSFDEISQLGCIVCRQLLGYHPPPAMIHHIRHYPGGPGLGQKSKMVIPLCADHHQQGEDAIHRRPALFKERYGTELELWELTQELLCKPT